MKRLFPIALVLAAACSAPPNPQGPAGGTPDEVTLKLRSGEAPAALKYDKNPAWLAEIGKALTEDRPWKSDADAFAAILHFATNAGPGELPVIESLLNDPKPAQKMRGILIIRFSSSPETLDLLQKRAAGLLDPAARDVAGVALGALGYRRARGATEAILTFFDSRDAPAALGA